MNASSVAFICAMMYTHRWLLPILQQNLDESDGEVLPHLIMSDVVRAAIAQYDASPSVVRELFDWLEKNFILNGEEVRNVIAVSGVEMIPDPTEKGSELRELLGPNLRDVDPWNQEKY